MKKPLKVLIVEDSADDANLLLLELARGDYEVQSSRVDTADAMKAALAQQTWDLILCDYVVPGFGALKALAVLQDMGLDLPVILISGVVSEETAFDALKAGARDFLIKGKLARLIPAVERELSGAAARRKLRQIDGDFQAALEKCRVFCESSPDGIWFIDSQLHTLSMNHRMAELLGVSPSPDVSIVEFIDDDGGRTGDLRLWLEAAPQPLQVKFRRRDGSNFLADVMASKTGSESSVDTGVLLMVRDVTAVTQMRDQLRQAQKMEAVGQLAGGVAHDFNNLLTVVLGNAEIVCTELEEAHPLRQEILEIQSAGKQAADLTRQLLSFSRRQILRPVVLDLNASATRTLQLLRRLLGAHIECVTALLDELGMVEADPSQVEQVLMNLAVNARDAMPDGGRLTIATANVELDERFVRGHLGARIGPHVMLEVRDTGTGMDAETLKRIFEPFFTTKEPGKGTGLGLATVYGIVKQSGGYIAVESTPGAGTTFKVYLPRTDRRVAVPEPVVTEGRGARGAETVLLVDDQPSIRVMAEKTLTRSGYQVIVASDPKDALARVDRHRGPLDLLVTDIAMPGASGVHLYRSLALSRPDLPVLYISGHTDDDVFRHGLLEPGSAFLPKPFMPTDLLSKVRAVLDAPPGMPVEAARARH